MVSGDAAGGAGAAVAPGETVASPCTSVCTIDASTGWCAGCFRTLDEIAVWSALAADDKRAVLAALPARRAAAHPGSQGER